MNKSNTRTRRGISTAAALFVSVGMLAACSPSGGTPPTASADTNGSLTFGYFEPATSLDPQIGTSSQDLPWLLPVYDTLFHYAEDGTVEPGLAESYDLTDTDMTLVLREGLTFHDGTPLDAAAVVANVQRGQTLPNSSVKGDLAPIVSAEAIDDLTVKLNLAAPYAPLPAVLADRAGMMISPTAFTDGTNLEIDPVGAGAWQAVEYVPKDHLDTERFDGYWDPDQVLLENVDIKLIDDDDTRLNALRAGEVDIAQLTASQVTLAEADSSINVRTDPALAVDQLGLNIATAPFDNPKVREAINYAIDREALLEGVYRGTGIVAWQPFPPGYFANDPDLEEMFPFDPDKAKDLLAEAGYPDGFSFDLKTNTQPFRVQATQAIAAMLADVGITTNIIPSEGPALLDEFYYQQTVPLYFTPWGGRADPSQTLDNLFGPNGLNNPAKITTPELTTLLEEGRATTDQAARGEIFQEASASIMNDSRMIPIMFPGVTMGVRDEVQNYSTDLTGKANFLGVSVSGNG